jgi:hypothetical protein
MNPSTSQPIQSLHGVMAEFPEPEALVAAIRKVRGQGYSKIEAYTPFPVEGLSDELGQPKTKIQWIILGAGICGGLGGFTLQTWTTTVAYPLNYGARPFFSWPAYMPVTFELTILSAAFAAVIGMIVLNGLPQPYHPVFNVKAFDAASKDKFFLCVESADPKFDVEAVKAALKGAGAAAVHEVEA